jgi:hypothetical protein
VTIEVPVGNEKLTLNPLEPDTQDQSLLQHNSLLFTSGWLTGYDALPKGHYAAALCFRVSESPGAEGDLCSE